MSKAYFEAKTTKELCQLLGLPPMQAAKIEARRDLVVAIRRTVEKHKWTHAQAAQKAKIGRTVITAIVNGNIDKISTDRLIDVAQQLGLKVHLEVA